MWAPSGPGPAGWDRRRVGARLRAALAGLQELQGLRATQQARVRGALGLHPAPGPRGQELRLEAALAALREQLSRLRRQDAGLKTHLDQLDQQISELQLDVSRSSCEALDSDSRPSSGFYELSDAGSCSLSTSCASVCSDRLSPSLGSWLPVFHPSKSRSGMGDWRPRSADETTVPAWSPQPSGEDSRFPHGAEDTGRPRGMFRPRPVSTGDLERVLPDDLGLQRAGADAAPPSLLCQGIEVPAHTLDPKYQRDLVARGGQEVYPYPSPLHAVALQSPLFALPKELPHLDIHSPPPEPPLVPVDQNRTQAGPIRELGSAEAYIHRLLRLRGQDLPLRDELQEQGGDTAPFPRKPCGQSGGPAGKLPSIPSSVPNGGIPLTSAARRKQRKWQSTTEISAKACSVSHPGPSLGPLKSPARKVGGPQVQSRPALARQDACVRSESDPSEHSAECASLFHSTIAETSEDEEASDHTANRFGDESSSNDSESCVQRSRSGLGRGNAQVGQRERAWPRVPPQQSPRVPGSSRPPLPPVPKLCRIKASKALKKKIRRFQPAALKVMTMV